MDRALTLSAASHVLLVGSYPLPYGGNSVHVQRLRSALDDDFRIDVIDLYGSRQNGDDPSVMRCGRGPAGMLRALGALRRSRATIAHFHVSAMANFLFAAYPMLSSLRSSTRKVITIHSGSFVTSFESGSAWRRSLLRKLMDRFDRIITVNDAQRQFLERLGIDGGRITVVPAFLPPVTQESARARDALAELSSCERVVVTSGCGLPHYGFETILRALERQNSGVQMGLIVCAYDSYDEAYMAELARRRNVRCVIVRDFDPGEFAWILKRSDLYVRATDRDGDAVAIREAAYFGKPVIASDCVERPAGSILFATGDVESLALALETSWPHPTRRVPLDAGHSGLEALRKVYDEALTAPSRNRKKVT